MALEPSIALGVKPIQIADPLAQYGQISAIQNAQNQNALAQFQLSSAQRQEAAQNALSESYKSAFNPETGKINEPMLLRSLAERGAGHMIPDVQAKLLATQKEQGLIKKTGLEASGLEFKQKVDKANKAISDIASLNSPQEAIASIDAHLANGDIDQQKADMLKTQVTRAPSFVDWQKGMLVNILDAKDKLTMTAPKISRQEAGGAIINIQDNPLLPGYGKPVEGMANIAKTATPGEMLVDARARERLAAEQATGVLTPASIDTAAEIYRQTGQMPIGGIGKGVANMRAQIMNRATEMAAGKGITPADTAANMIVAKQDVGSQTKALKDFSTGIQGRQVNAFNTAIDHLGTMDKLSDALANNDIKAFNALGNIVARQTGSPAPTNFDAAKQIVTAEVIKAVVASGGGVTERQEAERNFAAANSPEQLKGIIGTYKQLLGGQLNSLNLQYENTTGRKDFDKKLTDEAKNVVKQLRGSAGGGAAPAGGVDTSNPLLAK